MALNPLDNATLFLPPEPTSLESLDINPIVVEGLIMRLMYARSVLQGHQIASEICLPFFGVLEPLIEALKTQKLLEVIKGERSSITYTYGITSMGRERAAQYFEQTTYIGPAPISLDSYRQAIHEQSIHRISVNAERLEEAFQGLVFDQEILQQIGPAVNSGRSIFLYGPPGNGKTSVCERIVSSLGGAIFIPFAIEAQGQIIKLYDEYNHQPVPPDQDMRLQSKYDLRYKLIRRPMIIVGGELTLSTLDLIWNPDARYYEAPLQMKSNGGAFMIDDFGRQRIEPKVLLNRWIVPLEKRVDYLTTHTGTKIDIPFDELIVFSTNLNPNDLVDEAFLRRIRYKIGIHNPSPENFCKIWEIVSKAKKIPYDLSVPEYFIQKHLVAKNRPLRGCLPRDIIDYIIDVCRFKQVEPSMSAELLDEAAAAYFVNFESADYVMAK
jgi:hypothetical protein